MTSIQRELLVARVCSGSMRLRLASGQIYWVRPATTDQLYTAAELYQDAFREAELAGLYTESSLLSFLLEEGFWDDEQQKMVDVLPKQIEDFKVGLFKSGFKSNEKKVIRKALAEAKNKLAELYGIRHAFDHLSCAGAAALARSRYLIAGSLQGANGRFVFHGDDHFWQSPCTLLDEVMTAYAAARLPDVALREVAHTDPWRTVWNCREAAGSIFGCPAAQLTDEQRMLISWSSLYDGVYQNPDCPPEEVINDDDVLDGWLIEQRRKREAGQGANADQLVGDEKIRNSDEIYMPVDTVEDAKKVMDLNDEYTKAVQKQRFKHLREKGQVNELDMPDTRRNLRMAATQLLTQSLGK